MSKKKKGKKKEIYEIIKGLRESNKEFDNLVSEVDTEIEKFIAMENESKSFNPCPARSRVKVKVKAIQYTYEEQQCLLEYLKEKYISLVAGDYFEIKKCLGKFIIKSKYIDCEI